MTEHLEQSRLTDSTGFLLRLASAAIWSDLSRTLEPVGLKPHEFATLLMIGSNPGCKQQDVADALAIKRPNQVALVDKLAERALVDRKVNADDRRSYSLEMTPEGHALLAEAQRLHRVHQDRLKAALEDIDPGTLRTALRRLAERLGAPRDPP